MGDTKLRPSGDGGIYVPSSLWIDQPDAMDQLDARHDHRRRAADRPGDERAR